MDTKRENEIIQNLEANLTAAIQERDEWKSTWEDISEFVLPRRAGYDYSTGNRKQLTTSRRTDSTATEACTGLADGLMGYTVSPAYPWFKLRFEDDDTNKIGIARDWLDQVELRLYAAFSKFNFYSAMPEVFADGASIGTATLYIDESVATKALKFIAVHPFEVYIDEDIDGTVTDIYRVFFLDTKQVRQAFGDNAVEGDDQQSQKHKICNAIKVNDGSYGIPRQLPWVSVYWLKDQSKILDIEGYYENPYIVWRYRKNTGEKYGRSPAYDSMPDILTLQQVTKSLARGVQLAVDPPMNAPASMKGKINLAPKAVNYYTDPSEIISPVQVRGDYSLGAEMHRLLMDRVKRAFKVDIFLSLEAATRQMTAEEVLQRQGEKAAVLGAIVGRMGSELLSPIIQRVYGIEMRAGRLPAPPEGIEKAALKIEYDGPLNQAQKRFHQVGGLTQTLQNVMPILQANPGSATILDFDGIVRHMIQAGGAPASTYRDEREVSKVRQQEAAAMAEQQQMQMQMMQQDQAAKLLPAMAKGPEPGSPMEQLAAQAQGAVRQAM